MSVNGDADEVAMAEEPAVEQPRRNGSINDEPPVGLHKKSNPPQTLEEVFARYDAEVREIYGTRMRQRRALNI